MLAAAAALGSLLLLTPLAALGSSGGPRDPIECAPQVDRPLVYAIGSSTMGSTLGRIFKRELKKWGVRAKVWGKASSGIARPDFHDWPAKAAGIVRKYEPQAVIVALGTNDGQALCYRKRNRRKGWEKIETARWRELYGERVDRMLNTLSGPERERLVIWIGPTAHPSSKFNRRMAAIRDVIRARVKAFPGPAYFIDGYEQTLDPRTKRPRRHVRHPEWRKDDRVVRLAL